MGTLLFLDPVVLNLWVASLQIMQKGIQSPELRLPEPAVVLEPLRSVAQRPGFQSPRAPLRIPSARNQSRAFEYFKVLGNRGLAHRERLRQVRHRGLALGESSQDGPARRVGQRGESSVKISHNRKGI